MREIEITEELLEREGAVVCMTCRHVGRPGERFRRCSGPGAGSRATCGAYVCTADGCIAAHKTEHERERERERREGG